MSFTSANPHIKNECVKKKNPFFLSIAVLVRGAEEGTLISVLLYRTHKLVKEYFTSIET